MASVLTYSKCVLLFATVFMQPIQMGAKCIYLCTVNVYYHRFEASLFVLSPRGHKEAIYCLSQFD